MEDVLLNVPEEQSAHTAQAFQALIMQETETEVNWRENVQNSPHLPSHIKQEQLNKLEQKFYYRRVINATYF